MRKMKNSGIEWIGKIPKHWKLVRIGSLYRLRVEKISDFDYTPLTVSKQGIFPQFEGVAKSNLHNDRKLVRVGDFVINSRSDRRGSCGVSDYEGSVSLINTVLYPIITMHPQYYNWLFHTTEFADEFYRWGHGIVDDLWTTGWQDMKKLVVIYPPFDEQSEIASFIDSKCNDIDYLKYDIQMQIETLEEYKRSVITEAVTKGLDPDVEMKDSGVEWVGNIPEHWEIIRIKYLGSARNGLTYSPNDIVDEGEGLLVLRSSNIQEGKLTFNDNIYVKCHIPTDLLVRDNDILICSRNGSAKLIGKNALISNGIKASFGAFMMIFRTNHNANYLKFILNSGVFDYYIGTFLTSTINQLTNTNFSNMKIPYCTYEEEQQAIADYLDRKCTEIDSIIETKKQQLETLAEYKKSLIYEYVTGKKEVASEIAVAMVDPLLLLIAKILDNMPLNEGKIRVIKLALLSEYMYIPELETQYYRYKYGPYDVNIDKRLNEINKLGWFDISVDGSPMKWKKGKKYNKFKQQSQQYDQYDDKITALINSIGHYKESHIGRIATLFSVWNDFIIEGIPNPSDEKIIQEVINNWTPNKAKTAKSVWQHNLDEMKAKGIIPHGKGLHTKNGEEKT